MKLNTCDEFTKSLGSQWRRSAKLAQSSGYKAGFRKPDSVICLQPLVETAVATEIQKSGYPDMEQMVLLLKMDIINYRTK